MNTETHNCIMCRVGDSGLVSSQWDTCTKLSKLKNDAEEEAEKNIRARGGNTEEIAPSRNRTDTHKLKD